MQSELEKQVRFLKTYVVIATLVCSVLFLTAFHEQTHKQRFEEIDAERINIIERDGQVKMVISNEERLPGPGNIVSGTLSPRTGLKAPGILFYNEKGDECGGLTYVSEEHDGKFVAGSLLTFDKYHGDQVLGIKFEENNDKRKVGLNVWDQPDAPPEEQKKNWEKAHNMEPGPEKDALMQQVAAQQRVFVGRSFDKSATVTLYDANSRPRLRMLVKPDGEPKLEFLDIQGKVVQSLPDTSNRTGK